MLHCETEYLAVVALAHQTNSLASTMKVPVDAAFLAEGTHV